MIEPDYSYAAEVVRWIDGDSVVLDVDCGFGIWLRNESCRLYGIDTSETRGGTPELKWLGNLAKQFVNEQAPPGTKIIIKSYLNKKGKFGRILCEIYQPECGAEAETPGGGLPRAIEERDTRAA